MKSFTILFFLLLGVFVSSCKKNGTITATVKKQSAGQPIQVGDSIAVLRVSTSNNSNFDLELSSSAGIATFKDVPNGTYKVSGELWDGGPTYLCDEKIVDVENGKDVSVDLLLQ